MKKCAKNNTNIVIEQYQLNEYVAKRLPSSLSYKFLGRREYLAQIQIELRQKNYKK